MKLLYYPLLPNGKKAPLSWPIKLYRLTNHICWPLEDNAPRWYHTFDRFLWIFGFLIFIMHNDAELRYLRVNYQNLDDMLTGMPTYIILIEYHIRAFRLGRNKDKYKMLLKQFYAQIYIEESNYPQQFKRIQRQLLPVFISAAVYLITLIVMTIVPIYLMSTGSRDTLFKMIPPIEYKQNLYLYLALLLSNLWVGIVICTMLLGEATVLATLIFHLNGRYVLMRENFHHKVNQLLKMDLNTNLVENYRRLLVETLKENIRLNKFADYIQNEYTFQIFIIFAFSAMTLCSLGFKAYTSPMTSIVYILWTISKIQETLNYGDVGTIIMVTTDDISSMYYNSKWESVFARSEDTKKNIQLMKLITLSILTNKKPFNLTGLNFFSVSSTAVLKILQGAGSYFTCLIALR